MDHLAGQGLLIADDLNFRIEVGEAAQPLGLARAAIARQIEIADRLSVYPADLLRDEGWDCAVEGAAFVLRAASPMPVGVKGQDLITPSREGTRRVLEATPARVFHRPLCATLPGARRKARLAVSPFNNDRDIALSQNETFQSLNFCNKLLQFVCCRN